MKLVFDKLGVHSKKEFWDLVRQFTKFGIVGISNTLVSLFVYYVFLWANEDLYVVGSIVGTVVSIANAFVWNDTFVFTGNPKDFKSVMTRLGKTYISYGGTSLLSTVLLWVEVAIFSVDRNIAPIVNLVVTIPINYLINKVWTFTGTSCE